jgi:ABC-2 type transport system permease protein
MTPAQRSSTTPGQSRSTPAASWLALSVAQFRLQQRQFWRNRQSAVFSFGLPILFVVLFGVLFRSNGTGDTGGVPYTSYFVAGMIGISLMSATFSNLAVTLSFQRDQLILKRFRGTPLGPGPLFAGIGLNAVVVVAIQVLLILGLGRLFYSTPLPKNPLAFTLIVVVGIVVFSMAGIALTTFIANADSGPAVVQVPFLTLQFTSGVFFPFSIEPRFLKIAADIFPLRWLLDAIRAGYLGVDYFHTHAVTRPGPPGSSPTVTDVPTTVHGLHAITAVGPAYLVLGIWFVVFVVIGVRRFRWEPRSQ